MPGLDDIARGVRTRMTTLPDLADTFSDANCRIVDRESFDPESPHEVYAQIVVRQTSTPHAASGVPIRSGRVSIIVYARSNLDRTGGHDVRIADDDLGVLAYLTVIEDAMAYSYLDGLLLTALMPRDTANANITPLDDGWASIPIDFEFEYVAGWPAQQTLNDGSTPDCGQSA